MEEQEDKYELSRFVRAQNYDGSGYKDALREVSEGRKRGHWIWYVFPQIKGLGHSGCSAYYGIGSLDEARAYLNHPVLGAHLREIATALLQVEGKTAKEILGGIDAIKVRSSMTLFDIISPDDVFERVLNRFYNGERCLQTLRWNTMQQNPLPHH